MRKTIQPVTLILALLVLPTADAAENSMEVWQIEQRIGGMIADKTFTNTSALEAAIGELRTAFDRSTRSRNPQIASLMPAYYQQVRLAYKANRGDEQAWADLKRSRPATSRAHLYRAMGTKEAIDELAAMAAEPTLPISDRMQAIGHLGDMDDKRAIEIGLAPGFYEELCAWAQKNPEVPLALDNFLRSLVGREKRDYQRFASFSSIEEARRELLKAKDTGPIAPPKQMPSGQDSLPKSPLRSSVPQPAPDTAPAPAPVVAPTGAIAAVNTPAATAAAVTNESAPIPAAAAKTDDEASRWLAGTLIAAACLVVVFLAVRFLKR